jgi:MoaA/NifB/PqqE/SkfB family radical SAM enzyme
MWNSLTIYPTSSCLRSCPFCFLKKISAEDKPISFFEDILKQSRGIREWFFSIDMLAPAKFNEVLRLLETSRKLHHPYSILTNYENLSQIPRDLLREARVLHVGLDDYKTGKEELAGIFRTLAQAYIDNLHVEVQITVTPYMLKKMQESITLERLLEMSRYLRLAVPKSPDYPFLTKDDYGELLNFLVMRMRFNLKVLSQVEIESCLLPILNPKNRNRASDCPRLESLSLMPDGTIRICPYGRTWARLDDSEQFRAILERHLSEEEQEEFNHCCWRQAWEEESPECA